MPFSHVTLIEEYPVEQFEKVNPYCGNASPYFDRYLWTRRTGTATVVQQLTSALYGELPAG